jgi:hypothetical protein
MNEYAYSYDDEFYHMTDATTPESAAEEGFYYSDHDVISVGEVVRPTVEQLISVDYILENMAEAASDLCGEHCGDWLHYTKEDVADLKRRLLPVIDAWIHKNHPITFYTIQNVKEFHRENIEPDQGDD